MIFFGRKIRTFEIKTGSNLIEIKTNELAAGVYLLKVTAGSLHESYKLVIEN